MSSAEGMLSFTELEALVLDGSVETVVVAFSDHYGRTMGKRFDAEFFVESIDSGTHVCNYLFTVDMDMEPLPGFASANWENGYGDVHLVPDLATLRIAAWTTGTAFVLCNVLHSSGEGEHEGEEELPIAPRTILNRQIERASKADVEVAAASELEFFLFRDSYRQANDKSYQDLTSAGWYVEDYHLLQSARVEDYVGAARKALRRSGVPVENSKGEAAIGQHELNVRYGPALVMADRHAVMKQAMKELADLQGVSITFMAKPDQDQPGNSCHLHLSLWSEGQNIFVDNNNTDGRGDGRSNAFYWFLGGWMQHLRELMPFYAPTVNSYKRYQDESWAPTGVAWSTDNRTAGFRIVGAGSGLRIECRIPGADANPYLAFAAAIASGLDGIANHTEPPPEFDGNAYGAEAVQSVPTSLAEANKLFRSSAAARTLFGNDVVDHYAHFFEHEAQAFARSVTDWERRRYFEQI